MLARQIEEVLPHQREVVLSVLHVQLGRLFRSIVAEVPTIITGNFVACTGHYFYLHFLMPANPSG